MPLTTTGRSLRRLPLFFAYVPDRPGALAVRMRVRPEHWARWTRDRDEGYGEFGLAFLPPPLDPSTSTPSAGSAADAGTSSLSAGAVPPQLPPQQPHTTPPQSPAQQPPQLPQPQTTLPQSSAQQPHTLPPQTTPTPSPMAGSLMVFRAADIAHAWERITTDVYWTQGVWDREHAVVREFIRHELYNDDEA